MIDLHRHRSVADALAHLRHREIERRLHMKRAIRSAAFTIAQLTDDRCDANAQLVQMAVALGVSAVETFLPAMRPTAHYLPTYDLVRRYHRRFRRQLVERARAERVHLLRGGDDRDSRV